MTAKKARPIPAVARLDARTDKAARRRVLARHRRWLQERKSKTDKEAKRDD